MHKIQRVSYIFRVFFQVAFFALPIFLMLFWLTASGPTWVWNGITIESIPSGIKMLHAFNWETRFLGLGITLILSTGIHMLTLYFLIKLFHLYEKGEIFSSVNVNYIKNIGYLLLFGQLLINPLYQAFISAAITWQNPKGLGVISISLDQTNIAIVVAAVLIILISWIMAEGCKLREEHAFIV
jgi:hypothetical protein